MKRKIAEYDQLQKELKVLKKTNRQLIKIYCFNQKMEKKN